MITWLRWLGVALLLACLGCGDAESSDRPRGPLRFLALGDSYTAGFGIEEVDSWPAQLTGRLADDGIELETHTIAVSGWKVNDLLAGIEEASPGDDHDLVVVFIGTNDHYTERPASVFEGEFGVLLERSIVLAQGRARQVLVVGMPDWTLAPATRRSDIPGLRRSSVDEYNEILERLARSRGAAFAGLLEMSRSHEEGAQLFVSDGVHPNAALSALWAEVIYKEAARILAKSGGA